MKILGLSLTGGTVMNLYLVSKINWVSTVGLVLSVPLLAFLLHISNYRYLKKIPFVKLETNMG